MTFLLIISILSCRLAAFERAPLYPAVLFPYPVAASDEWTAPHPFNPAAGAFPLGWQGTWYYAKPYMLDRMNSGGFSLSRAGDSSSATLDIHTFGIPDYREDTASLAGSMKLSSWLRTGVRVKESFLSIHTPGYSFSTHFTDFDAGASISPFSWMCFAFFQQNISSLLDRGHADLAYPAWSAGISLKPAQGICFTWNLTRARYAFINSYAVSANIMSAVSLRAGYSRDTSSFAFASSIALGKILVSYGAGFHAFLGTTHSVSLTICSENPEYEQINYLSPRIEKFARNTGTRININSCSLEKLSSIPGLPAELATRIIRYRELIGPVSRKSLVQVGVTGHTLDTLLDHIFGLAPDTPAEKTGADRPRRFSKNAFADRRAAEQAAVKRLFDCLLEREVPAATALRLAEMARGISREEFYRTVDRMEELSEEIREQIRDQCGAQLP
jgi:hypothetical protein